MTRKDKQDAKELFAVSRCVFALVTLRQWMRFLSLRASYYPRAAISIWGRRFHFSISIERCCDPMEVEEDNKLNSFLVIDLKKTKGHSVKFYYRNTEDTFKNLKIIRCFNTLLTLSILWSLWNKWNKENKGKEVVYYKLPPLAAHFGSISMSVSGLKRTSQLHKRGNKIELTTV